MHPKPVVTYGSIILKEQPKVKVVNKTEQDNASADCDN